MNNSKKNPSLLKYVLIDILIGLLSFVIAIKFTKEINDPFNFLSSFCSVITSVLIQMYLAFQDRLEEMRCVIADNKYETSRKDIDTLHGLINTLYKSVERKCIIEKCNTAMCSAKKDCFFREFIINDFRNLYEAIERINNNNEYVLDKNIKYYHTIAIHQIKRQKIDIFNLHSAL